MTYFYATCWPSTLVVQKMYILLELMEEKFFFPFKDIFPNPYTSSLSFCTKKHNETLWSIPTAAAILLHAQFKADSYMAYF